MAIFPLEDWTITENSFTKNSSYRNETIFALSNGYIGSRGTLEELQMPRGFGLEGNYINGFYESEPIKYGEKGYAYPDVSQTMLNLPNAKKIQISIDGKAVELHCDMIESHQRILKMREGVVRRETVYKLEDGKEFSVVCERFASMKRKQIFCIRYSITPLNFSGMISLNSVIDGNASNSTEETNARIDYGPYGKVLLETCRRTISHMDDCCKGVNMMDCLMEHQVKRNQFRVVTAMKTVTQKDCRMSDWDEKDTIGAQFIFPLQQGESAAIDKFICYMSSLDNEHSDLQQHALEILADAQRVGFEKLKQEQQDFYSAFWSRADIVVEGDPALQQGIRFNLFQLVQGVGRDGKTNIGAKCLTGEGYEGHAFWDTEMYAIPFFLYNDPSIAKKLIEFRYRRLEQARKRAVQMDCNGALFPWRTINGEEASPYYPAGTAQYHINADIAFAVENYWHMTGDDEMLRTMGAEILLETARFWYSFGVFAESKGGKFCLNCVTGPDEYTALVNNNCYTNLMAKENLLSAVRVCYYLEENYPEDWEKLSRKCIVHSCELEDFQRAADNMYIPYDADTDIYWQDDSFSQKKPLDIPSIPREKLPIADHMHFLTLYRLQVLKQADTLLAMMVLSEKFSQETIRKNYEFYEPKTIHESSLSHCVHSVVAARIGLSKKAYEFFIDSARLDLDDVQGNTHAGIHMANLAGAWMCIVNGFAGMRRYKDTIQLKPWLPSQWSRYSFHISLKNSVLLVTVDKAGTSLHLQSGEPVSVYLFDKLVEVE